MPKFQVELDDGRKFEIESDSEPTQQEVLDALKESGGRELDGSRGSSWADKRRMEDGGDTSSTDGWDTAAPINELGIASEAISEAPGGGVSPSMSPSVNSTATRSNAAIAGAGAATAAPEALLASAPELAPSTATGVVGYLAKSALANMVSGAAGSVTDEALKSAAGENTPGAMKRIGATTAISGLATPLNPLLQKAFQGAAGSISGILKGLSSGSLVNAAKGGSAGGWAGLIQPLYQKAREAEVQSAREVIKAVTGEEAPQSFGEALGKTTFGKSYAQIERELGPDANGALSDDARNKLTKSVLFSASELAGSGADSETIAKMTLAALKAENVAVSAPVREHVESISKSLVASIDNELSKVEGEAASAISPKFRMTPTETGENVKQYVGEAQQAWRARQKELFDQYRAEVGDAEVAGLPNAKKAAQELLDSGLKTTDAEGVVSPIANTLPDSQAQQAIQTVLQAADTPQSIESLRKFISNFSDSIEFGVLSKIPDANKKALRSALKKDMMAGLEALPDSAAKEKLLAANKFTTESVDEMLSKSVTNAGRESGGTSAESIFGTLSSKPSEYKRFIEVMGDRAPRFRETMKNGILSEITAPGSGVVDLEGRVNAERAFGQIAKLPREIREDLGIDVEGMRKIALRQKDAQELLKDATSAQKKDPEAAASWLKANRDQLQGFLGPGGEKRFEDFVRAQAAQELAYKNSVLAEVARGESAAVAADPAKFVDSIITGKFGPEQSEAALALVSRRDPAAYADLQTEYLSRLLEKSQESGVISGKKLSGLIGKPVSGRSPSSGGDQLGLASAVLGKGKVDDLRMVADKLGTVQDSLLHMISNPNANSNLVGDALYSMSKSTGAPGTPGAFHNLLTWLPKRRYQFLAKSLNNPEMRSIISKPARDLTGAEASALVGAISAEPISN